MIKINNIPITNPITTFTHNQKEKLTFECTSGIVTWELLRYPISCNKPTTLIGWGITHEQTSVLASDFLTLNLTGTYKIQITWTSASSVIVRYMVIIEAKSLKNTITIPFGGESVEMDSVEGWAKKVEKNLQVLDQNSGNLSVIGTYDDAYSLHDLIVGDLVCITGIKETYQSGFIYKIIRASDYTAQNGIVGIIIDVKESSGSVEYDIVGKYYTVAFKGSFLLDSFPFSDNIYYDYSNHLLDSVETGNLFVGKYINDVLIIENEMWFDVEIYIPSAMNISKGLTLTKTKQLNFIGENVEVSGDLDPDTTTNVTILGQQLALNGVYSGRMLKYLNFVSDEISINTTLPDYINIVLADYPFLINSVDSLIYPKNITDSFVVGSDNINDEEETFKLYFNKSIGSFGFGYNLIISNGGSVAFGIHNVSNGISSFAEGYYTEASGDYGSHAEGKDTIASGQHSHAEGSNTQSISVASHAEGYYTEASGDYGSHAEGVQTLASGEDAHAEGWLSQATGNESHAEGHNTIASGVSSHAEGESTTASCLSSHAEGTSTTASGENSHAEGYETEALGSYSHSEGESTTAEGNNSHAEGKNTYAEYESSHAEGDGTHAGGQSSHTEGRETVALGSASHAEGRETVSLGPASHAEGHESVARYTSSHAFANGKFTVVGDAQGERLCGKCITINEDIGEILNIQLPDTSLFGIEGNIICSTTDFLGAGFCKIKILCKCVSNVITIIDETKEDIYGGIEALVSTSSINNNLIISIQYVGSITTFYWVGTFNLTELIIDNAPV